MSKEIKEYKVGQKIKFSAPEGNSVNKMKWRVGKIHGVRTKEVNGIVVERTYLIDTGEIAREDVVSFKETKSAGRIVYKPDKVFRQPEQVELSPEMIRPI